MSLHSPIASVAHDSLKDQVMVSLCKAQGLAYFKHFAVEPSLFH